MRLRFYLLAVLAMITSAACQPGAIQTDFEKANYSIGYEVGYSVTGLGDHLDMDALRRGIEDARADADPVFPLEELQAARDRVVLLLQQEEEARLAEASERNLEEGPAYLAANAARDEVIVTESGLQYEILREGDGVRPGPDQRVTIHYSASTIDGTVYDSSHDEGMPVRLAASGGSVMGLSEGLQLMSAGAKFRLVIPSELAYGDLSAGRSVTPHATLIFEVEMLELEVAQEGGAEGG